MLFNMLCITLGFLTLLYSLLYLARVSKPAITALGLAAGFLLLAFGNLHKFQSINAVGFEATLKESLSVRDSSISALEETVAPLLAKAILEERARSYTNPNITKRYFKLTQAYLDLGIVDAEVEKSLRPLIIKVSREKIIALAQKVGSSDTSLVTPPDSLWESPAQFELLNLHEVIKSLPVKARKSDAVEELISFYKLHNLPLEGAAAESSSVE